MTIMTYGKFVPVLVKDKSKPDQSWAVGRECTLESKEGATISAVIVEADRYLAPEDDRWALHHAPRLRFALRLAAPEDCVAACTERNLNPIDQWTWGK